MACEHTDFRADADVYRCAEGDDPNGPIARLHIELQVSCTDCGCQVHWLGVSPGLHPDQVTCDPGGIVLRAPGLPEDVLKELLVAGQPPKGWG
jgi:hypothetical protein